MTAPEAMKVLERVRRLLRELEDGESIDDLKEEATACRIRIDDVIRFMKTIR